MISLALAGLVDRFSKKLGIDSKEVINANSIEDIKKLAISNDSIAINTFAKIKEAQKLEKRLLSKLDISLMEEIAKENSEKDLLADKMALGEEVVSNSGILNETSENRRKKKNLSDPSIEFKSRSFSLDGPGM